ncbi:manganese peroxidase [Gautieria morchelliformis]|nr:manganese peroxidase [Gautieria morchelliformis]
MVFVSWCFVAFLSIALAAHAATTGRVKCPHGNVASHSACCVLLPACAAQLADQKNFFSHQCGEDTHETLRLSFRRSIPRQRTRGSQLAEVPTVPCLFSPTSSRISRQTSGFLNRVELLTPFLRNHTQVSAGDLIQFAAAVALGNCPPAPKLEFMAGRPNPTAPASDGLIPESQDSVDKTFARMKDGVNFSPDEVVALLASHSIARSLADHVDPSIEAVPFDSTPFTFDTQIFVEVLLKGTGFPGTPNNTGEALSPLPPGSGVNVGEMRLQCDFLIARDPRTACTWQGFVTEQERMSNAFRDAMAKLAVIGQNPSQLVNCSQVSPFLPPASRRRMDLELRCCGS